MKQSATHHWLSIDCWTCELRSDEKLPTTMQCRSHSRRRTSECLFVTACSMDEYAEEKKTEKNLIVRSGISEAETTNNKRLRSTFCTEAIQTRSIARPLCDSRASCLLFTFDYTVIQLSRTAAYMIHLVEVCVCVSVHMITWKVLQISAFRLVDMGKG